MNSVYVETASRLFSALCAAKQASGHPETCGTDEQIANYSFDAASVFMKEYTSRNLDEQAILQRVQQQNPGGVMGADALEIRQRGLL